MCFIYIYNCLVLTQQTTLAKVHWRQTPGKNSLLLMLLFIFQNVCWVLLNKLSGIPCYHVAVLVLYDVTESLRNSSNCTTSAGCEFNSVETVLRICCLCIQPITQNTKTGMHQASGGSRLVCIRCSCWSL